ncbi:MAG: esterase-like activity of phytase family protein [Rhizobiales bacterium]|nr:esterase-like activity of phytase family protein [Hyphomicrobiales bacterium]
MRLKLILGLLAALTLAAKADPIAISTNPLNGFASLSNATDFGPFLWRGGLELTSSDETFGGLSGLTLSEGCTSVLAVSDKGRWFRAALAYEDELLTDVSGGELAPMLDSKGQPLASKANGDAEALAGLGAGRYMVGFERRTRIGVYDIGKAGLQARFQLLKSPKALAGGPRNGELESVGQFTEGDWKGHYLAISENNTDPDGDIRGWLWQSEKTVPFAIKRLEDYGITDAAILPDGDILILERSFGASLLPGMAIRRIKAAAIGMNMTVKPELLFSGRAPFYAIDNMEGIALCKRNGETRLTIVSDNNFNTALQRTLLLQFAYEP